MSLHGFLRLTGLEFYFLIRFIITDMHVRKMENKKKKKKGSINLMAHFLNFCHILSRETCFFLISMGDLKRFNDELFLTLFAIQCSDNR